jgi:hypothetical protein
VVSAGPVLPRLCADKTHVVLLQARESLLQLPLGGLQCIALFLQRVRVAKAFTAALPAPGPQRLHGAQCAYIAVSISLSRSLSLCLCA